MVKVDDAAYALGANPPASPAQAEVTVTTAAASLGAFKQQARSILPQLTDYLDAEKYSELQIYSILLGISDLAYVGDAPEQNWDLVLPSLKRLERQAQEGKGHVPYLARLLAHDIPQRIELIQILRSELGLHDSCKHHDS